MANKLMSIIVLNWNRLHYTKQTVERIVQATSIPAEIILVDNNSLEESGVRQYLLSMEGELKKKFREVKYVFNNKNLGVAGGRNSGLRVAQGDYLVTIDDDVLVPKNWGILMAEACDRIPKLGVTGVNVEPFKYPVKIINGAEVRVKSAGNLGGACLCLPRRVFDKVGYYGFGRGTLYAHEDSFLRYKLNILGLISAYIKPKGVHLDKDKDKEYRKEKNKAHEKGSMQLSELSRAVAAMRKTGDVYTPYTDPDQYCPVDEDIFTNELISKG